MSEDVKADSRDTQISDLQAQVSLLMDYKTNFMHNVCVLRGVTKPCRNCGGSGVQIYNNVSTWKHDDQSTKSQVKDMCEHCWGSGDSENAWPAPSDRQSSYIVTDADIIDADIVESEECK